MNLLRKPAVQAIALFMALAAIITLAAAHRIGHANYETSDFAANSILTQKAKAFDLLTGNYSRVGFNHPGPALLAVLAMGEAVLFDWFHVVSYPIQGQMIAAGLLSAFWLTLIAVATQALARGWVGAALLCCPFLLTLAVAIPGAFDSLWFPHLYVLPFAALLLTCACLIVDDMGWMPAAVLSALFLMHGHVSFIATAGLILVGSVGAHVALKRRAVPTLDRARQQRIVVATVSTATIVFAFALPVALRVVRTGGRPFTDYSRFAGSHHTNGLLDALSYLAQFWGAPWLFTLGVCFAVWAAWLARDAATRTIGIVTVLATASVVFYALRGVDDFGYAYICEFYYAVPAILAGEVTRRLIEALPRRVIRPSCFGATVAAVCLVVWSTAHFTEEQPQLANSSVMSEYLFLNSIASASPVALNIGYGDGKNETWGQIAGIAALTRRAGGPDRFCIDRGWVPPYDDSFRCDRDASEQRDEIYIGSADDQVCAGQRALFRDTRIVACRPQSEPLAAGQVIPASDFVRDGILRSGWTDPTGGYAWSLGREATARICTTAGVSSISATVVAYLPRRRQTNSISVSIDEDVSKTYAFTSDSARQDINYKINHSDGCHVVRFVIADDRSPLELGESADPRPLGIYIENFRTY